MQKQSIDKAEQKEALERLPEFQAAWDKEAASLMTALFEVSESTFAHHEMRVTLTVCKFISVSNPFIVKIKPWLRSHTTAKAPWPMHGFVDLVFHEFLHTFVVENFARKESSLLHTYKSESKRVKAHLHLMALQKAVYLHLGRTDLLSWTEHFYTVIIGRDYARAWEIIDRLEDHRIFVNEFRLLSKP